jgi:hypothetical protein
VQRTLIVGCVLLAVSVAPAAAQWINHPTPGIPRTKDGKPNLNAPAPRTADRKPDLSGMWNVDGLGVMGQRPRRRDAAVGAGPVQRTARNLWARRSRVQLSARGAADGAPRPRSAAHRPDAQPDCDPLRGRPRAADLPRRPSSPERPDADVDGVLGGQVGRRHAGGRDDRLQRPHVARHQRASATATPCTSRNASAEPASARCS